MWEDSPEGPLPGREREAWLILPRGQGCFYWGKMLKECFEGKLGHQAEKGAKQSTSRRKEHYYLRQRLGKGIVCLEMTR